MDPDPGEHAANRGVDQVVNRLGVNIKCRDRGEDDRAGFCGKGHQTQVPGMEGRLSDGEKEGTAFLQADIGCALDQVLSVGVGDPGEGLDRAGDDHHAISSKGTGGDGCTEVPPTATPGQPGDEGLRVNGRFPL